MVDDRDGRGTTHLCLPAHARLFGARHAEAVAVELASLRRAIVAASASVASKVVYGRAWVASGCWSLEAFATERLGMSVRTLRRRAALGRGLRWFRPLLRAFFGEDGGPPLDELAASIVASIASRAHVRAWIDLARALPVEILSARARAARAAGGSAPPEAEFPPVRPGRERRVAGDRARVPAVPDVAEIDLRGALAVIERSAALLDAAESGLMTRALVEEMEEWIGYEREIVVALAEVVARMDAAHVWPAFGHRGYNTWAYERLGAPRTSAHELLVLGRALQHGATLRAALLAGAVVVRDVVRAARGCGPALPLDVVHALIARGPRSGTRRILPSAEGRTWIGGGQLPESSEGP